MSAIAVSQASSPGSATTFTSGMSATARSEKVARKASSLAGILRSGSCSAVVAAGEENRGIGIDGDLPWRLPGDMKHFRTITTTAEEGKQNAVIMGRRTWESIPSRFRPLPKRLNIILSKTMRLEEEDDANVAESLDAAVKQLAGLQKDGKIDRVFVIGGAAVYAEALQRDLCDSVHLTSVHSDVKCDTYLPDISSFGFTKIKETSGPHADGDVSYTFQEICKESAPQQLIPNPSLQHEEMQYLRMIEKILLHGNKRMDRTGTGTLSCFGETMRYSLRDGTIPVLTTKRVFWRGVAEELLWFVSGNTNAKDLQDKNIHIWDRNGSREYLDSIGLTEREEMDLGPVYGFQWRHFGAEYKDMHADYAGEGVDQIASKFSFYSRTQSHTSTCWD